MMTTSPLAAALPADAAEREAALNVEASFLVEAPAGSGKTGLLVQRMLRLLCRVDRPELVLALTFTNKATAEMRERILQALDLVERDPATLNEFQRSTREAAAALLQHESSLGWKLRENSYRLNIRTIDSLCGEIARSLPLASSSVGQLNPVEDANPLYLRAARAVTLKLGGEDGVLNDALRTVLLHRDADLHNCESLLASMLATREQWSRLIPLTPDELTDDFLDREVKPKLDRTLERIVCAQLTTLQHAFPPAELHDLAELAAGLASAPLEPEVKHPLLSCVGLRSAPGTDAVAADQWAALAHLLLTNDGWRKAGGITDRNLKYPVKAHKARLVTILDALTDRDDLHAMLCDLRNLPPASLPAEDWRVTKALFHLLHDALIELRAIFRDGNVCDFTERSIAARAALQPDDGAAPTPKLELAHLLVDEMQDTSSAQYELLEALTHGWDGRTRTVFLVGDPKQSIYLFRQARVERFVESLSTHRLGDVPLHVLRLSTNFRSAAPLVQAFNQLFEPVFEAANSGIRYTPAVAAKTDADGAMHWQVDPLWGDFGKPERRNSRVQVRREQAEHLVRSIHQIRADSHGGKPPSIAVLVRSREHAARIIRLLSLASIPFRGVELERLDERAEVLDLLALTRALLHPADRVAWLAVLRAPWCGATLAELHHLAGGEEQGSSTRTLRDRFRGRVTALEAERLPHILHVLDLLDAAVASLGRMPISELVERTARALGMELYLSPLQQKNAQRFLELVEQAEAEQRPFEADDLKERLARLYASPDNAPGAVDVMTIHKAKGLEWDVVFVPELQRSSGSSGQRLLDWLELPRHTDAQPGVLLAPIAPRGERAAELGCYVQTARRQQEEAEVARLLYVVLTRARHQLFVYAAPELKKDNQDVIRKPGTLLAAAWPGAGATVQAEAARHAAQRATMLPTLLATTSEAVAADLADLRRVPAGFDARALQPGIERTWHLPQSTSHAGQPLEAVHREEGALASRAIGRTMHLFLDLLATLAEKSQAASLKELSHWECRIRAVLRDAGCYGKALADGVNLVRHALESTLRDPLGRWLLQPHPLATTEQSFTDGDSGRTLRLDRSFLAGDQAGVDGQSSLWIVDYKTATPGEQALADFLRTERERYAPQLRNYARLRRAEGDTPARTMLALYYPLIPALDAWSMEAEA